MSAPRVSVDAAALDAVREFVSRVAWGISAIAADVALLRAMADAERQADGRAAYPQPRGWTR